jgi:hypothetical protein
VLLEKLNFIIRTKERKEEEEEEEEEIETIN